AGRRLVAPAAGAAGAGGGAVPDGLRRRPERLALLPLFDAAARDFGVPADLFKAMTWQESGWQNDRVSSARALGIGQLMPDTVSFVNGVLLRARLDPNRPEDNIRMSARFLAYLLRQNDGDEARALASYYQGLASVRSRGPLPQTVRYVANVLALREKF
ncbi:MAG: lytic transglycosylase domain-containing protein, partial [Acidimicrobiia bacterium]